MDTGLIHKIAVLGKDYYVNRTIDDLFVFAGALPNWWKEPNGNFGSERMNNVYGWIEGIKQKSPEQLEKIILGVATQMSENEDIPEGDRNFLKRGASGPSSHKAKIKNVSEATYSKNVEQLLETIILGLARAMFPFKYRRKGSRTIDFEDEYDVQTLLHALLRPWIKDIRPEEYTPSYAGSSTRIDFLLPRYDIVIEVKFVRDLNHSKTIGNELIIDIAHYRVHPNCQQLWIVVFDPRGLISNPDGLINDLDGKHESNNKGIIVKTYFLF